MLVSHVAWRRIFDKKAEERQKQVWRNCPRSLEGRKLAARRSRTASIFLSSRHGTSGADEAHLQDLLDTTLESAAQTVKRRICI